MVLIVYIVSSNKLCLYINMICLSLMGGAYIIHMYGDYFNTFSFVETVYRCNDNEVDDDIAM